MFGLTRWTPFGSPFQLHREIDDLFNRFFGQTWGEPAGQPSETPTTTWLPAMESYTHEGNLCVRVALPGVDPKDVEVSVSDNLLTIKGARRTKNEQKEGSYFVREFAYGAFERTVALPQGVDASKVNAKYTNGMLEVTMPAPVTVVPKKVEIKIEGQQSEAKAVKAA